MRRFLRTTGAVLAAAILLLVAGAWVRWRLAFGSERTVVARVRFQMIDLGQGDPIRAYAEQLLGNERLWLDSADPSWIYVPREVRRACWEGIRRESYFTREVAFTMRKLAFGGYAPATGLRVNRVDGSPLITK